MLDLTHSATDLGIVLGATWVPQLILVLFGGVLADRLPRHLVMVGSNVVSGLAQGGIAFLLLSGHARLWHLIVLQVVRGVASSFFWPASPGLVPQTVRPDLLQAANVLLGMTRNGTNIVGAALGGRLVALTSPGWALVFDAATYLASGAILAGMRLRRMETSDAPNLLRELREGWHEFASRTWLWAIVAAAAVGNVVWMGATQVLGPLVAKQSLGGAGQWGAIVACQGAGLLAGGLLMLRYRPRRPLFVGMAAFLPAAIPIILLAYVHSTPVIAAGYFVNGISLEIFSITWATALQQHIPVEKLSRVSAYDLLGSLIFVPIGLTIAGPLAGTIGLKEALLAAAAIGTISTVAALCVRDVRELRRLDEPQEPTAAPYAAT